MNIETQSEICMTLLRIANALERIADQDLQRIELLRESNANATESLTHTIEHNTHVLELFSEPIP